MLDSVTPSAILAFSANPRVVALYDDGLYDEKTAAIEALFANSVILWITVTAGREGDILDVENGDATPEQAPEWVTWMRELGVPDPWVYCNSSTLGSVRAAFAAQGVVEPHYWVAEYLLLVGQAPLPPTSIPWAGEGAVAWQYASLTSPNVDLSVVADGFPIQLDPPAPRPSEEIMPATGTDADGRPFIFYAAAGSEKPTILTQTAKASDSNPFGVWEWGDMSNAIVTTNGTPPSVGG
jgi:hypothetical protein